MTRYQFYRSDEWLNFRKVIIAERTDSDGYVHCEICGKPILKKYDLIVHHKKELTDANVLDATVALNPDNVSCICFRCHNLKHERFVSGHSASFKKINKKVFIVYGSPLSGKTTFVNTTATENDLIVDLDSIWQCVSINDRYNKPPSLNSVVFEIRDKLYDIIKFRSGKWENAYVITSGALIGDRERLKQRLSADEFIYIESTKDECLQRLQTRNLSDDQYKKWYELIENWYATCQV